MYNFLLIVHSWNRWLVLIFAILAIFRALQGWRKNEPFLKPDRVVGGIFVGLMHLQFLTGLILYIWLSPITQIAFSDFGAAMKNPELRFFGVEHITGMIIAVIVAQIGRTKSKKAPNDVLKHKRAFIFYTISVIIIIISMPFVMRPLLRI